MAFYSYKKNKTSYTTPVIMRDEPLVNPTVDVPRKHKTLGSIVGSRFDRFSAALKTSRVSNAVIPLFCLLIGFAFIYQEFFPQVQQMIREQTGYYSIGNLAPVDEEYYNITEYVSRASNLSELTNTALNQNILPEDIISKNYTGTFYISIPSIGMERLAVTANVDSSKAEAYLPILDKTLAHFQSTGLPISDVKNNIVIYGHSASPNYHPNASDPMVAFSFLPELKVGDDIYLEMEGEQYHFKMQKSKIVDPNDTGIITGTKNRRTLTLFTCFPLGTDAQRYVAVARPV